MVVEGKPARREKKYEVCHQNRQSLFLGVEVSENLARDRR